MMTEKIQLEDDEKVLVQVRKHWFLLSAQVCGVLVFALLPLPFAYVLTAAVDLSFIGEDVTSVAVALYVMWLIIMWMTLFSVWTNYYLDTWIVTTKRLIAVEQNGFFHRTVASFRLERMQDIRVSVNGLLATFLDYGTLEIQTAGEVEHFKVFGLPSPADIKSIILESADVLIHKHNEPIDAGL